MITKTKAPNEGIFLSPDGKYNNPLDTKLIVDGAEITVLKLLNLLKNKIDAQEKEIEKYKIAFKNYGEAQAQKDLALSQAVDSVAAKFVDIESQGVVWGD